MKKKESCHKNLNCFDESHLPSFLNKYLKKSENNEEIRITSEDKNAIKEWFDQFFNTEKFYEEGSELYIHSERINALLNYMKINQHGHNHNVSVFTNAILIYLATKGVKEYNNPHDLITKLIKIGTMGIMHDIGYLKKYSTYTEDKKQSVKKNADKHLFKEHAKDGAIITRKILEKFFEENNWSEIAKKEYKDIKLIKNNEEDKFINEIVKGVETHSSPVNNNPNETSEIEKETELTDMQSVMYLADKIDYFNEDRTPLRLIWEDVHREGTIAYKRIAFATEKNEIVINNKTNQIKMVLNIDPNKINEEINKRNIENGDYLYTNWRFVDDYIKYFGKKTQPIIDKMSKLLFTENNEENESTFYTEINFKNGETVIINNETLESIS